jgi:hypothetical protein
MTEEPKHRSPSPEQPPGRPGLAGLLSGVLFVVLAVYVSISGVRLAGLLWQRLAGA